MSWFDTRDEHAGAGAVKKSYEVVRELPDKPQSERISKHKTTASSAEQAKLLVEGDHNDIFLDLPFSIFVLLHPDPTSANAEANLKAYPPLHYNESADCRKERLAAYRKCLTSFNKKYKVSEQCAVH